MSTLCTCVKDKKMKIITDCKTAAASRGEIEKTFLTSLESVFEDSLISTAAFFSFLAPLLLKTHQQKTIALMKHRRPPTAIPTMSTGSADLVEEDGTSCVEGIDVGDSEGRREGWRVASTVLTGLLSVKVIPMAPDACVATSARPVLTEETNDAPSLKPTLEREVTISKEMVQV